MQTAMLLARVLLTATSATAAQPVALLHYDFGRVADAKVIDLSGNGRSGEVCGTCATATVGGRKCLVLSGKETRVEVPGLGGVALPKGITIEAQLRIDAWDGHFQRVVIQKAAKSTEAPWELVLGERGRDGTLGFVVRGATHRMHSSGYTDDLKTGTWYHIVATYGPSGTDLYVNGVLKQSGRGGRSIARSTGPLVVGGGYFKGAIQELLVVDRALSGEEVKARCKADPTDGVFLPSADIFTEPTNLVPNGDFELADGDGRPVCWQPVFKTHPRYGKDLSREIDATVHRGAAASGESSLRLTGSGHSLAGVESLAYSVIDYTKTFTLGGQVKCAGATGTTFLEIAWYRFWLPMGYGWVTEDRNYGSHWDLCEEVGVSRSSITSGTHGWRRISVTAKPPHGANFVRFRIWSMNNRGQVWIDDLRFDGFGEAPAEIHLSQSGFSTGGSKRAVVRTRDRLGSGTFCVANARTGQARFEGKLTRWGQCKWGRQCWVADFSDLAEEGQFRLSVRFDGGATATTPAFAISAKHYDTVADLLRNYFYLSRCGCEVPGFHKACHLDDGQLRNHPNLTKGGEVTGHVDLSGGWHDAGDYDKFPRSEVWPVIALCRYCELAWAGGASALADKLFSEARWGAEHLMKCMAEDGRIYYKVLWMNRKGQIKMFHLPPEDETDNIVGTTDDRVAIGPGEDSLACMAVAKFAETARGVDPDLSRRATQTAIKMRGAFVASERKMTHAVAPLCWFPNLMMTDMMLCRLTGDQAYREHAREMAARVIAEFAEKRYRGRARRLATPLPYSAVRALEVYALDSAGDLLAAGAREAVRQFLREEILAHANNPYGHYDYRRMQDSPWRSHASTKALALSSIFALASILFDEPDYLRFAENELQYIMGLNPLGLCQIGGLGWKQAAVFAWSSSIPGRQDGTIIPGAISKGIPLGSGAQRLYAVDLHTSPHRNIAHPKDYPYLTVAADYPVMGGAGKQEFFEVPAGACLLAIHDIQRATKHLLSRR